MNSKFDELLAGKIVDGVKWCEFNSEDYETYLLESIDIDEVVDGVTYTPHYAFINVEDAEVPYTGILYRDVTSENDVKFRVVGAMYEVNHNGGWCDFDTMFEILHTK